MIHRHVEIIDGAPVNALPSAALVDILHRGDLEDYRPIAAAIAREPRGDFAERVMKLVDAFPAYGSSALWRQWIDHRRAMSEGAGEAGVSDFPAIRNAMGLTQKELAKRAGMSQSDLSKFERRSDFRISTLRKYVTALGGRLKVLVETERATFQVRLSCDDLDEKEAP